MSKLTEILIYNGELEMLVNRMLFGQDYVDSYIIVTNQYTFQGEKVKESQHSDFEYLKNYPIYANYISVTTKYNKPSPWQTEKLVRNAGKKYIDSNSCKSDYYITADIDEIPNYKVIKEYINNNTIKGVYSLNMNFHYYNFNYVFKKPWCVPCLVDGETIQKYTLQEIRNAYPTATINNGGWHLSYFMTPERIKQKIESFSHSELNLEKYKNLEHINNCIEKGLDLFGRKDHTLVKTETIKDYNYDLARNWIKV